jgi:hypothetical protein
MADATVVEEAVKAGQRTRRAFVGYARGTAALALGLMMVYGFCAHPRTIGWHTRPDRVEQ